MAQAEQVEDRRRRCTSSCSNEPHAQGTAVRRVRKKPVALAGLPPDLIPAADPGRPRERAKAYTKRHNCPAPRHLLNIPIPMSPVDKLAQVLRKLTNFLRSRVCGKLIP